MRSGRRRAPRARARAPAPAARTAPRTAPPGARRGSAAGRARLVRHGDPSGGGLPDDDPSGLDLGVDPDLGATQRQHEAHDEEDERGTRHHEQLGPAPPGAHDPRREPKSEDRPPERGDPPHHAPRRLGPRRHPDAPGHPATCGVDAGTERAQRHTESAFVAGLLTKLASRQRLAHADARSAGGAMSPRIWSMTCSTVAPANWASAPSSRRWESTGSASILMSSGMT